MSQLFIPNKIKVGFRTRGDTYTGKLAYVIYFDHKGTLRKEKSWESWRDKEINPLEFDNIPIEGFVLNKGVGGARRSYGWNTRNEYIRVYDPRDFEFEISVENLLFILRECDCTKGKGLEGKFVYSWNGTELVLLPVISQDYQNSTVFTTLQSKQLTVKDLVPGGCYLTKKNKNLIYLGKFSPLRHSNYKIKNKENYVFYRDGFVLYDNLKGFSTRNGNDVVSNLAELIDEFNNSPYNKKVVELLLKPRDGKYFTIQKNGKYERHVDYTDYIVKDHEYWIEEGQVKYIYKYQHYNRRPWVEPTGEDLYVKLENGREYWIEDFLKF